MLNSKKYADYRGNSSELITQLAFQYICSEGGSWAE